MAGYGKTGASQAAGGLAGRTKRGNGLQCKQYPRQLPPGQTGRSGQFVDQPVDEQPLAVGRVERLPFERVGPRQFLDQNFNVLKQLEDSHGAVMHYRPAAA